MPTQAVKETFRKKFYGSVEKLHKWLDHYSSEGLTEFTETKAGGHMRPYEKFTAGKKEIAKHKV